MPPRRAGTPEPTPASARRARRLRRRSTPCGRPRERGRSSQRLRRRLSMPPAAARRALAGDCRDARRARLDTPRPDCRQILLEQAPAETPVRQPATAEHARHLSREPPARLEPRRGCALADAELLAAVHRAAGQLLHGQNGLHMARLEFLGSLATNPAPNHEPPPSPPSPNLHARDQRVWVSVNSDSVGPQDASRLQKSLRGIAPSPPLVPSRESLPLV